MCCFVFCVFLSSIHGTCGFHSTGTMFFVRWCFVFYNRCFVKVVWSFKCCFDRCLQYDCRLNLIVNHITTKCLMLLVIVVKCSNRDIRIMTLRKQHFLFVIWLHSVIKISVCLRVGFWREDFGGLSLYFYIIF